MGDILSALPEAWRNHAVSFMAGGIIMVLVSGWSGVFRADPRTGAEGRAVDSRVDILERDVSEIKGKLPEQFPPMDWQIWRQTVTANLNDIRKDDRHTVDELNELKADCGKRNDKLEDVELKIQAAEQSIDNLWKWYQRRNQ